MDQWTTAGILAGSAFAAGAVNALAGGGTLLTFPALLAAGASPVSANVTSTVALVPGSLGGAWGYRREVPAVARWIRLLLFPSLVGGLIGSLLVILLPERYFARLVPWLILTATALFLLQPAIARWCGIGQPHADPTPNRRRAIIAFQFLVAVYGGYFGAGIGILMLAALSSMGLDDVHRMNAVKTVLAAVINGVSVAVFAPSGEVRWSWALVMAAAATAGGFAGAHFGQRIPRSVVRTLIVLIGLSLSAKYLLT